MNSINNGAMAGSLQAVNRADNQAQSAPVKNMNNVKILYGDENRANLLNTISQKNTQGEIKAHGHVASKNPGVINLS